MKRTLSILRALALSIPFAACGSSPETRSVVETASDQANETGNKQAPGQLMVGADKQELVLPDDFLPYYGFRGRNFSTVIDPLYARCVALNNGENTALFVAIELGDVGGKELEGWLADIVEATGISEEYIYVHAVHTHSAPYAGSDIREDVTDVEKSDQFAEICGQAILTAVQNSLANMQAATMNYAAGECYINVNRNYRYTGDFSGDIKSAFLTWRNYQNDCDHTVQVIKFDDMEGNTIAYWTNYAVHSLVTFHVYGWEDDMMAITGDISGRLSTYVEERDKGSVCIFTMGTAGNAMPRYVGEYWSFDAEGNATTAYLTGEGADQVLQVQADELGEAVITTVRGMDNANAVSEVTIEALQTTVSLPGKQKWTAGSPTEAPTGTGEFEYDLDADPLDVDLGLLKVNDFAFAMVGAEIVTSIGYDIQETLNSNGCSNTMVVSQTNGSAQYISDDYGYDNFTFEGVASWAAPGADQYIVEGLNDLLSNMNG